MYVGPRPNPLICKQVIEVGPQAHRAQRNITPHTSTNGEEARLPSICHTAEDLHSDRTNTVIQMVGCGQPFAEMSNSGDASLLLVLLCFLHVSAIAKTVLRRAGTPRKCWNELGEVEEVLPLQSGLSPSFLAIIISDAKLDEAISALVTTSVLHINANSGDLSLPVQTRDSILGRLDNGTQTYWRSQALLLICHGFPRDKYLEPK